MRFPFPQTVNATVTLQKLPFLLAVDVSLKQWWAVDLVAICQVHLVRVVTVVNYKPDDLVDLVVKVGEVTTPESTLNFIPPV